jgi:hypothetical protein
VSNSGGISVKCVGMAAEVAEARMRERGYDPSPPEEIRGHRADEEIDIRIFGQIASAS